MTDIFGNNEFYLRANKVYAMGLAQIHKLSIFSKKTIAGVQHGAVMRYSSRNDIFGQQIPREVKKKKQIYRRPLYCFSITMLKSNITITANMYLYS